MLCKEYSVGDSSSNSSRVGVKISSYLKEMSTVFLTFQFQMENTLAIPAKNKSFFVLKSVSGRELISSEISPAIFHIFILVQYSGTRH